MKWSLQPLKMPCHKLEWLTLAYEYFVDMLSLRILGASFLSLQDAKNANGVPKNYECLMIVANCIRKLIHKHVRIGVRACKKLVQLH